MLSIVEVAPRRAHINRKGRWSEQRITPTVQGRGDKGNHFYQSLILHDVKVQCNG